MTNIQSARINTAGAYVCIDGLYPFALGTRLHNGQIPVIRLGGHREEYETGWECAAREAYEEACLQIKPLLPRTTYLSNGDDIEAELQEIQWRHEAEDQCIPFLVTVYHRENTTLLSMMYLAQAEGLPQPSSEVKGLLLLEEKDIHDLCQQQLTLERYLGRGGKAILNGSFDEKLVLEPFVQLRLLSRILNIQSQNKTISEGC